MRFLMWLSLFIISSFINLASAAVINQMDFERFINGVAVEAIHQGISEKTVRAAFHHIQPVILRQNQSQTILSRKRNDYAAYMSASLTPSRIVKAREYFKQHAVLLNRIANHYHIPPNFLVSIWGLETNFGQIQGEYPAIATLATQAYAGRRQRFFRLELMAALRILDKGIVTAENMKGSWAGAMGQCQLLPEEYLKFSVDFDGCGQNDIWTSVPDALASMANYLRYLGWNEKHGLAIQLRVPQGFYRQWQGFNDRRTVTEWNQLGVRDTKGRLLPDGSAATIIIPPEGYYGPAYLVYLDNFRVVYRWNHSDFYVLSVALLANEIQNG